MRHIRKRLVLWLAAMALAGAVGIAPHVMAQEKANDAAVEERGEVIAAEVEEKAAEGDDEEVTDIRVNTYPDANANLRLAEQKMIEGDFTFAFKIYSKVLDEWPDLLFKVDTNLYYGVRRFARLRMMMLRDKKLGGEAVQREGEARRMFEKAKAGMDESLLRTLHERYFWTAVGAPALETLGDLALERHAPTDAVIDYWRLLEEYDLAPDTVRRVRRKLVAALSAAGDAAMRRRVLNDLLQADAEVTVSDGRRLVSAAELLERSATPQETNRAGDWPEFMGGRDRLGAAESAPEADVRLWFRRIVDTREPVARRLGMTDRMEGRYERPEPLGQAGGMMDVNRLRSKMMQSSGANPSGLTFESFPVVSGDRVSIVDNERLVALDRLTGDLLWEVGNPFFEQSGDDARHSATQTAYVMGRRMNVSAVPLAHTLTVRGSLLYGLRPADGGYELLAIDLVTGKRVGMVPGESYRPDFLKPGVLASGFTEHGGRLYMAYVEGDAGGRRHYGQVNFAYEHLVCIDVQDPTRPRLLWDITLYGSAGGAGVPGWDSFSGGAMASVHVPTVGGDGVYYNSDDGAIVSVDSITGDLRWIYTYDRYVASRSYRGPVRVPPPFGYTAAPLYRDGILLCMPSDAYKVFALEAETGKVLWSVPREGLTNVVGLVGETLVLSGDRVTALDWRTGAMKWTSSVTDIVPVGRGCLAGGLAYVPARFVEDGAARDLVLRFDVETGKMTRPLELDPSRDEIGNLVVAGDVVLSMNSHRITALGDADTHLRRIDDRLAEAPGDAAALFRLGQIRRSQKNYNAAIEAFEKALANVGGRRLYQESNLEDLLKNRLYELYRERTAAEFDDKRWADALSTVRETLRYAVADHRVVETRLAEADLLEKTGKPAEAALVYQRMKSRYPQVVYRIDADEEMTARLFADVRIGALAAEYGEAAYRLVEAEAQKLLDSEKPEDWRRVVVDFGPSRARPEALLKLAGHAAADDPRTAARYYKRFYQGYRDDERALPMAARAVALYDEAGAVTEAVQLLKRVRRYSFDTAFEHEGAAVTGGEFAASMFARPAYARVLALPGEEIYPIDLPIGRRWTHEVESSNRQAAEATPFDRDGKAMVMSVRRQGRTGVAVQESAGGKLVWRFDMDNIRSATLSPDRKYVVAISHHRMVCLDSLTGKRLWEARPTRLEQAKKINVRVNQNSGRAFGNNTVCVSYIGNRRVENQWRQMIFIAAYRLDSGKLAWVATVDGAHPSTNRGFDSLVGMGDKLVTGTMTHNPQHGEPALYVWSFESGKLLKKVDLEGRGLTGDLIRVDGSRVAAAYTDERNRGRVGIFDVEKGAFAWSAAMTINSWNGELRLAGERLVLSNNHGVEAFELESGKALWSNNLSRERRMVMDVTADPTGVFVLHGDQQTQLEQKIVRLDADTGKRAWTYSLPKSTGAFRLAQSQDYLVAPMMEGRPRENAQNARMRLSHFQLEKTMLACIDKQAGTRSFVTDVGKLKDMRYVNVYRPPALVTVAEDAVYVTMQDSLYVYGGTR